MMVKPQSGLTLVELMITVIIIGILASLAIPAFTEMIIRRRVEGIANNLIVDLQYARYEAAKNGQGFVNIAFGPNCYLIYLNSDGTKTGSCTNNTKTLSDTASELKLVQISSSDGVTFSTSPANLNTKFDYALGTLSTGGTVSLSALGGTFAVNVILSLTGRVIGCAPSGSKVASFPACT